MDSVCGFGRRLRGQSLRAVAPGISEELVTTAAGLFAAIPALIAYNYFLRDIRNVSSRMDSFATEFVSENSTRLVHVLEHSRAKHATRPAFETGTSLSEIKHMVPFIDVVLVLLIIFMITAPILQSGIDVDVPKTKTVKELTQARMGRHHSTAASAVYLNDKQNSTFHQDWAG